MKVFNLQVLIFISIPLLCLVVITLFYQNKLSGLKLNENVNILVCGDSHTQAAINDSIIPNSLNISKSSEHFLYTKNVLEQILSNKSNVHTIILGCSFHSFGKSYDDYVFGKEATKFMYPSFFPILSSNDKQLVLKANTKGVISAGVGIYKSIFKSIANRTKDISKYPFAGAYYRSYLNNLNDSTNAITVKRHYYTNDDTPLGFATFQKEQLGKIVDLCQAKNLRLILINTPIHKSYREQVPAEFVADYYSTIKAFVENVEFWDYSNLNLGNTDFGDGDHLNASGSDTLSFLIKEKLNKPINSLQ